MSFVVFITFPSSGTQSHYIWPWLKSLSTKGHRFTLWKADFSHQFSCQFLKKTSFWSDTKFCSLGCIISSLLEIFIKQESIQAFSQWLCVDQEMDVSKSCSPISLFFYSVKEPVMRFYFKHRYPDLKCNSCLKSCSESAWELRIQCVIWTKLIYFWVTRKSELECIFFFFFCMIVALISLAPLTDSCNHNMSCWNVCFWEFPRRYYNQY